MTRQVFRLAGLYIAVAIGIGLIYYRGDRNVSAAVVAGLIAGAMIIPLEMRFMKNREQATERVLSRFPYFEVLLATGGIGLVVVGAVTGSVTVALSGLPVLGIAAIFLFIKYGLRRRLRSRS